MSTKSPKKNNPSKAFLFAREIKIRTARGLNWIDKVAIS